MVNESQANEALNGDEPVIGPYTVGDSVWIYVNEKGPHLQPGKVMGAFQHPWHPLPFYIIQLDDSEYLHMECRDAVLMTPDPDVAPPYVRRTGASKVYKTLGSILQ